MKIIEVVVLACLLCLLPGRQTGSAGVAAVGEGNICKELGVDSMLNAMYNSDGSQCKNGSTPSYHCSGLFLHGRDESLGDNGPRVPYFQVMIPPANLSTNIPKGSVGTACPVRDMYMTDFNATNDDVTSATAPLPFWCPTYYYSPSFTFIRGDTPAKPWTSSNGILFSYQPIQNISSSVGGASFWDNRLAAFFPSDASTYGRFFCGIGPKSLLASLGIGSNASIPLESWESDFEKIAYGCQYVKNMTRLQEYVSEVAPGIRLSCPENITSGSAYFDRLDTITQEYWNILTSKDEKIVDLRNMPIPEGLPYEPSPWNPNGTLGPLLNCYLNNPNNCFGNGYDESDFRPIMHDAQCPVQDDRFDDVFIEAAQSLDKAKYVDNMFANEVVMHPYGGIPNEEVFKYMALYSTTENSPEEQYDTLLGADFIYNTTGIRVPAVLVHLDPGSFHFSCLEVPQSFSNKPSDGLKTSNGVDTQPIFWVIMKMVSCLVVSTLFVVT